jgi:DNA-binding response OmpR family regulator
MDQYKRALLIVDDDDDIREVLMDIAAKDGYAVHIARDGLEALSILRTTKIDAVLTDLMMPNMNGSELILRTRSLGRSVPFVMVSGLADEEAVLKAFRSGACDYVAKPFSSEGLRTIVNRVLDIGDRQSKIDQLLTEIANVDDALSEKVEKIRRNQQQVSRLLAIGAI